ncbi:lysylphosphatidylglycerol synthase transmembrane domain-containing protein [Guyparkeria halophila]|uniref:Lysylphosphatidylglycerol synthase transmembrane domain-containing protein n=1 Tax=Guyparkeria halophila TaxID=47960 RepID=A0ABZ0YW60_9GAMM|nr:lysylphosphatidylglycerol synthase transmembrane domain-containing protein [Guyparkeria halophila]WQH16266.1 lysylphosphatidylglycerol synthase transmembrane domain-containing protein [Guyparkeria halophila]
MNTSRLLRWKSLVGWSAFAATLYVAFRIIEIDKLLAATKEATATTLALIVASFVLMRIAQAYALKTSLSISQNRISSFGALDLIGTKGLFNLGMSGAGVLAQGARAKEEFGIPYRNFAAAALTETLSMIFVLGALLTALATFGAIEAWRATAIALGSGAALAPILLLSIWHYYPKLTRNYIPFINRHNAPLGTGENVAIKLATLATLQLVFILTRVARFGLIALTLDASIPSSQIVTALVIGDFATLVPLTPGGVGIRELTIGAIGNSFGTADILLAAAIIDRLVSVALNTAHGAVTVSTRGLMNYFADRGSR